MSRVTCGPVHVGVSPDRLAIPLGRGDFPPEKEKRFSLSCSRERRGAARRGAATRSHCQIWLAAVFLALLERVRHSPEPTERTAPSSKTAIEPEEDFESLSERNVDVQGATEATLPNDSNAITESTSRCIEKLFTRRHRNAHIESHRCNYVHFITNISDNLHYTIVSTITITYKVSGSKLIASSTRRTPRWSLVILEM